MERKEMIEYISEYKRTRFIGKDMNNEEADILMPNRDNKKKRYEQSDLVIKTVFKIAKRVINK